MAIVLQKAGKQGFFVISGRNQRKNRKNLRSFDYFYAKQSQFLKSQMNVYPLVTMDYENISDWTLGENKPNSNPIKPNLPEGKIDAKCVFTEDYEEKCG